MANKKKRQNGKRKYQKITDKEEKLLKENGISKERFYGRIATGWDREKALKKAVAYHHKITDEERKLMKENGIDNHTFRTRIARNMNRKEAATKPKRKYRYKKH